MDLNHLMITIEERINAFAALGSFLKQFSEINTAETYSEQNEQLNQLFFDKLSNAVRSANFYNGWFTEDNVRNAISSIALMLDKNQLEQWVKPYLLELKKEKQPKRVGVIMAGNIPLTGFHDFLSVLISGNTFVGKLSSQDKVLLPLLADILIEINGAFQNNIAFIEGRIGNIDAIIATGSNNTSRYFEYYFGKYPHIIRKNRNSVAVLTGKESHIDLFNLGYDIFQYFGLGCRNVSKIFIPKDYDFDKFFKGIYEHQGVANNHKYANNYHYNKTIYLLNNEPMLDNGFLVIKEDAKMSSPVGMLFYQYYDDLKETVASLKESLNSDVQCVVAGSEVEVPSVNFGCAQSPSLTDYADRVDTVKFLTEL
jgi:hypothetical protein